MKRRIELDWVRAVSMLGVVMIHASAPFIFRDSRFMLLGVTPALFCNQATRVAVPLFFLLSGLGLGLGGKPVKLPGFWLKRLWRVGVPYLLWSLFYFLLDRRFQLGLLLEERNLRELGWLLLLGGAAFLVSIVILIYGLIRWTGVFSLACSWRGGPCGNWAGSCFWAARPPICGSSLPCCSSTSSIRCSAG